MKQPSLWYDDVFENGEYWNDKSGNFHSLWDKIWSLVKGENVLDLGCGPGLFAKRMPRNVNYTGVDFSEYAVNKVRELGFKAILMDLETDIINFNGYDCVILCEVLEHIDNDIELLRSIPKGILIVGSVPMFDDESHVRYFKSVEEVKNRYNFKNVFEFENRFIFYEKD
jgi:2-polyprenyl-3-methyl-5-hydroxy-6-metoxy-1,4-benzoquinol methylase